MPPHEAQNFRNVLACMDYAKIRNLLFAASDTVPLTLVLFGLRDYRLMRSQKSVHTASMKAEIL
jgi:hypothetical protein